MSTRLERKLAFIRQLAEFLVANQSYKSIALEMAGDDELVRKSPCLFLAQEWAALHQATPLQGYLSVDEAEQQLKEFLL